MTSGLTTIGVLKLLALAAPTFGVYASMVLQLAAEVVADLQLSADVTLTPPEIGVALEVALMLLAQLDLAVAFSPPSFNVEFGVSLSLELALLLGIVAVLQAAVSVGGVAGIEVLTYQGTGAALGGAVGASIAGGWSGGTPPTANVSALVLGATSSAAFAALRGFFDGVTFAPGVTVVGQLSLSALMSADFDLLAGLLSEFQARAKAAASCSLGVSLMPPTVQLSAELVAKMIANLKAAITVGMPTIGASLLAYIQARISLIGQLTAQLTAQLAFATDGFDAFAYSGPGSGLGASLTTALAGGWPDGASPGAESQVVMLVATTPAASAALSTFFPPVA